MIDAQPQNTLSESGRNRADKELFLEVCKIFQDYYKSDLAETLAKIPELGLQLRKKNKGLQKQIPKICQENKAKYGGTLVKDRNSYIFWQQAVS